MFDGAEGGHGPAEGGAVAVLAGDLVGPGGGDEQAAGLFGFLAHGQRFRRQDAAGEKACALLLRRLLHFTDGCGWFAFRVQQRVGQRPLERRAVLLDGQLHAQVGKLAVGGKGAGHRHRAPELDSPRGLRQGIAGHAEGCGQGAQSGDL